MGWSSTQPIGYRPCVRPKMSVKQTKTLVLSFLLYSESQKPGQSWRRLKGDYEYLKWVVCWGYLVSPDLTTSRMSISRPVWTYDSANKEAQILLWAILDHHHQNENIYIMPVTNRIHESINKIDIKKYDKEQRKTLKRCVIVSKIKEMHF